MLRRLHPTATSERLPLHDVAASRRIERERLAQCEPHVLMRRAGTAVARLALAVAPHALTVWVACGPGNNGGDGLQAAAWLQRRGKRVVVTLLGVPDALPADARAAHADAVAAGVIFADAVPSGLTAQDLCIDALLGLGSTRAPAGAMRTCIRALRTVPCPVLAIDVPSGLEPNTGAVFDAATDAWVAATHTVSLLTLKPGLFTAQGRDAAGCIWWDGLDDQCAPPPHGASAWLQGASLADSASPASSAQSSSAGPYASHKGSFGDVCIVGGAPGMGGAPLLAGGAALHAGAGRVYVGTWRAPGSNLWPELMWRDLSAAGALDALPLATSTTACGCGGGRVIAGALPHLLERAARLVIDADALNAIAADASLQQLLRERRPRGQIQVLTPHPTEAARLLGMNTPAVQADRPGAAAQLAERYQSIVVLKGSGTLVATPAAAAPVVHFAGNARLATAGTGDVLAGCMASFWEQSSHAAGVAGSDQPKAAWALAARAASAAVQAHGQVADTWPAHPPAGLTAAALANALQRPPSWPGVPDEQRDRLEANA